MLRRLKQKNRQTQKTIAELSEQEAREREEMARLELPLPEPDLCPECYLSAWHILPKTDFIRDRRRFVRVLIVWLSARACFIGRLPGQPVGRPLRYACASPDFPRQRRRP